MTAIYKRELRACLQSFIGFLFIAVTLFFIGLYHTVYGLMSGYPYFSAVVSSVTFMFLITVPVLTMRVLAEEKRSKTDQLILTAPVTVGAIVMGKFLALVTIFAIPTGIACFYPLILCRYGTVPLAECYLSILGFFLYGVASIALGILISSLTESQVIAAVLSFALLFVGYMMSGLCNIISSTGNLLTKLLSGFDMYTPFERLTTGTLDITAIVYYVLLIALLLFLTVQSIQKRRYSVSVKNLSMGAYSTGMIILAIGIVVTANLIVSRMPSDWTAIDLTSNKLYSLTQQTKDYLETVKEDVTIYVIVREEEQDATLGQTLQRYEDSSTHIRVQYVDPQVNPRFHTQYTDSSITMNSLIVVSDRRSTVIDYSDIYETGIDYTTYTSSVTGYDGEGQITSALDYVLSDELPKVYLAEGHGEYELDSTFLEGLTKENVTYESLQLLKADTVPEDAACLIINSAVNDFSQEDVDKVIAYLEGGGKVVLVAGYTENPTPNLDGLLSYMGLHMAEGMIVEQNADYYYRIPFYLLPEVANVSYTNGIYGQYYIFAPYARGILISDEEAEGLAYESFLTTSDSAFSKVDISRMEDYGKSEGDIDGPFAIGVKAEKSLGDKTAVMVVYGCDQIFTDEANSRVADANRRLFVNTVGSFADHEVSVSVPVKSYEVSYLAVTWSEAVMLGALVTILLPLGCLIWGFVIWLRRRKR
ncbi:MAG: Gldg family protein [Roseburia sp.]|nr:Gldg family protein [Roseburia sp.]